MFSRADRIARRLQHHLSSLGVKSVAYGPGAIWSASPTSQFFVDFDKWSARRDAISRLAQSFSTIVTGPIIFFPLRLPSGVDMAEQAATPKVIVRYLRMPFSDPHTYEIKKIHRIDVRWGYSQEAEPRA